MRLNKYIADTGYCSRREADTYLQDGKVTVDGDEVGIGADYRPGSNVRVNGYSVEPRPKKRGRQHVYIALNKPDGITSTTDTDVSGNIVDFVGHEQRIFPVGRLDKDSEGLILLTSNGDIVNEILRAENHREKEYLVGVNQVVTPEFLRDMARGVRIRGQLTLPCKTSRIAKFGFRIVLTQGLNRQIRLMAQAFGYRVTQLRRVRIDNIRLGDLKPGRWRNLTDAELRELLPTREEF